MIVRLSDQFKEPVLVGHFLIKPHQDTVLDRSLITDEAYSEFELAIARKILIKIIETDPHPHTFLERRNVEPPIQLPVEEPVKPELVAKTNKRGPKKSATN